MAVHEAKPDPGLPKPDLSDVQTADLLDEVFKRADQCLCIIQIEKIVEQHWEWTFKYKGSPSCAIGLAARFQHEAMNGFPHFSQDDENDDEDGDDEVEERC